MAMQYLVAFSYTFDGFLTGQILLCQTIFCVKPQLPTLRCDTEEIFDHKQLRVLHTIGLLMVMLATITLPYLTAGNLVVFTAIR